MKNIRLLTASLLALAGIIPASASASVVANSGDLILGFRTNDNAIAEDLEVDLGNFSNFTNLAPGTVLNLNLNGSYYGSAGGLSASDLSTTFGTSWDTLTDIVWSVAGQNNPSGATSVDLYATFTPANGANVNQAIGTTQNNPASRLRTELGALNGQASLASPEAAEIASLSSSQSNYSGAIRGTGATTKDYGYFIPTTEALYSSSSSSSLDLFQLSHTGPGTPGTDLGTFTLDSAGDLTFSTPVPEPSTYAAVALGGAMLFFARRRRTA